MVRRWLASLKSQRERWAVARIMFVSRMFATRWKLRARKAANLTNKGANIETLLTRNVTAEPAKEPIKDFTKVNTS
jgi:hypothetical protein